MKDMKYHKSEAPSLYFVFGEAIFWIFNSGSVCCMRTVVLRIARLFLYFDFVNYLTLWLKIPLTLLENFV